MKQLISILLIVFCSCGPSPDANQSKQFLTTVYTGLDNTNIYEYEIDSCVYIGYIGGRSSFLSHKGNCPNPIHYK